MALLIRSYHDMSQFLAISCQDLTLRYPWRVKPGIYSPALRNKNINQSKFTRIQKIETDLFQETSTHTKQGRMIKQTSTKTA